MENIPYTRTKAVKLNILLKTYVKFKLIIVTEYLSRLRKYLF